MDWVSSRCSASRTGVRLTPKGLFRWHTTCCNTPVGNTLRPSVPFVGIVAQAFDGGALRAEMRRWRDALAACYAAFDAVAVSWETVKRVGTRASHVQAQVVPVPRARAAGLVACFCEAAAADGLAFEKDEVVDAFDACDARRDEDVGLVPEDRDEFIRLEVDGHVLLALPRGARFNLQFARETLAAYLGMPERGDWRACTRAPDAEAAEVEEFKRVFDAYALE